MMVMNGIGPKRSFGASEAVMSHVAIVDSSAVEMQGHLVSVSGRTARVWRLWGIVMEMDGGLADEAWGDTWRWRGETWTWLKNG